MSSAGSIAPVVAVVEAQVSQHDFLCGVECQLYKVNWAPCVLLRYKGTTILSQTLTRGMRLKGNVQSTSHA